MKTEEDIKNELWNGVRIGVLCPPQGMFYCISKKEFWEFFKIWSFMSGNLFEKFPKFSNKIFEILPTFSKLMKIDIFVPKLVQNHYVDQNLAILSHRTPKNCRFSLKTFMFYNFRRLWRRKSGVLCPKNTNFFGLRVPPIHIS